MGKVEGRQESYRGGGKVRGEAGKLEGRQES